MFRGLLRNVLISALAFFAVSVIGLLIVPVLIRAYGLEGFGLIALARMFLPITALAVLDMGFGEVATNAVATSRARQEWTGSARLLSLDGSAALSVGAVAGLVLLLLAGWIPGWCQVPAAHQEALTWVLRTTGIALPVLMFSLVAEGVVKGHERYGAQRTIEVVASLTYAAGALGAAQAGLGFQWVCYALLVSLVLRALLATAMARRALAAHGVKLQRWTATEWAELKGRAKGLSHNKLLGVAQMHVPSFLITIMLGPAALGVFDALSRLPRFAKSVLGLLGSTVQPVAARLDEHTDEQGLAKLGRLGLLMVGAIAAPVLATAIALSEPILRLWLGPSVAQYWGWQAAYFVVPALGALLSFGGSALLGRRDALAALNRTGTINVAIVLFGGLLAMPWLHERAFIASQVLGSLVAIPLGLRVVAAEMGLERKTFTTLARLYAVVVLLSIPVAMYAYHIQSAVSLLPALAAWALGCWVICLHLALTTAQRQRLRQSLLSRFRPRPRADGQP